MLTSHSRYPGAILTVALLALAAGCAQRPSDRDIATASERLAHLFDLREYEIASSEGRKWQNAGPRAFEPRAWFILATARTPMSDSLSDSTVAWGEAMVRAAPRDPWSWLALAGALDQNRSRYHEAVAASDSMMRLSTDLPFLRLRLNILRGDVSDSAALAFIDGLRPAVRDNPVVLVSLGRAQFGRGMDTKNDSLIQAALASFARARAADSTNVDAYYLAGTSLVMEGRVDDAFPLLQRAADLSSAVRVHQELWRAIQGRRDFSAEQKQAAVRADAEALMKRRDLPSTLQAVAEIYKAVGLTAEARKVADRVLTEYPYSEAAEWVLVDRYRAVAKDIYQEKQTTGKVDPAKQAEYRRMLDAYVARPKHVNDRLLGDAYRELFLLDQQRLAEDSTVNGDSLYSLVRGMVDYEGINPQIIYGAGAVALADDRTHLEEAERIAREGIAAGREKIDEGRQFYESHGLYQQTQDWMASTMYDALGWVYLAQGRVDIAEDTLRHAVELDPRNLTALDHLGHLYERRAGSATDSPYLDSAQDYFIRGAMVQTMGTNPSDSALQHLYERRHGSLAGWEAFHASIATIDRARRHKAVLAARKAHPEMMKGFTLTSLGGSRVDSRKLRGKILVLHFWGTWCGPCVTEMPEFEKFYEKYRRDADVAIYTVDYNDPDPDDVRTWMKKHKYDFPVLLDGGYVASAGVYAFPTTWFVDREGRIEFVKTGESQALVEEFGWRVEALRQKR